MAKQIKIQHKDGRTVDGVKVVGLNTLNGDSWEKDGLVYCQSYGWSEVKEPTFVDVTEDVVIDGDGDLVVNNEHYVVAPFAHSFSKKRWFDLPENLVHDIFHMTPKGIIEYIQRFKKPCLIVEKEEG